MVTDVPGTQDERRAQVKAAPDTLVDSPTDVPVQDPSTSARPHPVPSLKKRAARRLAPYLPKGFRDLLKMVYDDWKVNGRDATLPGFRAVAVYRFGTWARTIRPAAVRIPLARVYLAMYRFVRNHYGVEIELSVKLGRRLVLGHQGNVVIHQLAEIGDDCVIRQNVTLGAATLGLPFEDQYPVLGDRVEIGAGATVIGRVVIGNDVRIGPNAVVMTDVPAGATVFASPSRIIPSSKPAGSSLIRSSRRSLDNASAP